MRLIKFKHGDKTGQLPILFASDAIVDDCKGSMKRVTRYFTEWGCVSEGQISEVKE